MRPKTPINKRNLTAVLCTAVRCASWDQPSVVPQPCVLFSAGYQRSLPSPSQPIQATVAIDRAGELCRTCTAEYGQWVAVVSVSMSDSVCVSDCPYLPLVTSGICFSVSASGVVARETGGLISFL